MSFNELMHRCGHLSRVLKRVSRARQFEYKGNRLPEEVSEFSGTVGRFDVKRLGGRW